VRDLAGNLSEWTRSDALPPGEDPFTIQIDNLDCLVKGGSGFDDLEPFFHLGGQTRERKKDGSPRVGFRLVAYRRDGAQEATRVGVAAPSGSAGR